MSKIGLFILIFVVIFIYQIITKIIKHRKNKKVDNHLFGLKQNGIRIVVNLENCEIKTNQYIETEPNETMPSQIEILDSLSNRGRQPHGVSKVISVLRYNYQNGPSGKIEFRSEAISMPVENLKLKLEQRKQTTIFVDADNLNRYYFDIEFL
jgi:hypothetical protein